MMASIAKYAFFGQLESAGGKFYLGAMDNREVMSRVGAIIDAHGTGLLATVDEKGDPHVRWLTPAVLRDRPGALYAITAPKFAKVVQVRAHPRVEWMFQTPTLDEVITVRGPLNVVENPSLRAEVLEMLGPRLRTFWKLAHDARDLVVLETVIEEATRFLPMDGRKDTVRF
jgi:general stress protein 26